MCEGHQADKWELRNEFTSQRPKLLLVEGKDEWSLLTCLLQLMNISAIDVRCFGGTSNLAKALKTLAQGAVTGFDYITCMSVLRDADEDAGAALQSVKTALEQADFASPGQTGEFAEGRPRVGIYILPDGHSCGSLENLCLSSSADAQVMECVEGYFECLQKAGVGLHPNFAKTKLHAYLASRSKPGLKIGEAAHANYLNFEHDAWAGIKQFLQEM